MFILQKWYISCLVQIWVTVSKSTLQQVIVCAIYVQREHQETKVNYPWLEKWHKMKWARLSLSNKSQSSVEQGTESPTRAVFNCFRASQSQVSGVKCLRANPTRKSLCKSCTFLNDDKMHHFNFSFQSCVNIFSKLFLGLAIKYSRWATMQGLPVIFSGFYQVKTQDLNTLKKFSSPHFSYFSLQLHEKATPFIISPVLKDWHTNIILEEDC